METQLATDPNRFTQGLFDGLPRRYDRLAEVLSFGQNARLATGHGRPSRAVGDRPRPRRRHRHRRRRAAARRSHRRRDHRHRSHPRDAARRNAPACRASGASARIALVAGNAEVLPFPDASFDALTFTYLLRYVHDPAATMRELARVLKPGAPDGEPRLRRSRQPAVAVVVVVLHAPAAPSGRAARRVGLGAGRPLPRSEHQRASTSATRFRRSFPRGRTPA